MNGECIMKNENLTTEASDLLTKLTLNDGETIKINKRNLSRVKDLIRFYNILDITFLKSKLKEIEFDKSHKREFNKELDYRIKKINKIYNIKSFNKIDKNRVFDSRGCYLVKKDKIRIEMKRRDKLKNYERYLFKFIAIYCHELAHSIQKAIAPSTAKINVKSTSAYYYSFERNADRFGYIIYKKYFSDIINVPTRYFNAYIDYNPRATRKSKIFNSLSDYLEKDYRCRVAVTDYNKYKMKMIQNLYTIINPKLLKMKLFDIKLNETHSIERRVMTILSLYYDRDDVDYIIDDLKQNTEEKEKILFICIELSYNIQCRIIDWNSFIINSDIYKNSLVKANLYLAFIIYKKYFSDLINIPINKFYWKNFSYDKIFK